MSVFRQTLQAGLAELRLEVDAPTLAALERHWRLVTRDNQKFNLTAIVEEAEAARKHYLDCLLLLPRLMAAAAAKRRAGRTLKAADIGSGAGFPGLALALACPHSEWLLLEASAKKCDFLNRCIAELSIKNARALPLRAETAGQDASWRGKFDLVTARALAALPVLLEYALPLLQEGGTFIAAKGPALQEEEASAHNALALLGGEPYEKQQFTLPGGEKRLLAYYRKNAPTPPKYPRRAGIPEKRPL